MHLKCSFDGTSSPRRNCRSGGGDQRLLSLLCVSISVEAAESLTISIIFTHKYALSILDLYVHILPLRERVQYFSILFVYNKIMLPTNTRNQYN